jgi:hypothetical protein
MLTFQVIYEEILRIQLNTGICTVAHAYKGA